MYGFEKGLETTLVNDALDSLTDVGVDLMIVLVGIVFGFDLVVPTAATRVPGF